MAADMATTTGTGHSPKQERHIAKILFSFLGVAVIVGLIVAFAMAHYHTFSPYQGGSPTKVAPDTSPTASH
jgi:hypothetical protein